MFHDCDIVVAPPSGPDVTIHDMGFGRAPHGSLFLLAHPRVPGSYTTDASLQNMTNRMAFAIACISVTILGVFAVAWHIVQMFRPNY